MSKITVITHDRLVQVDGLAYEIAAEKWPSHDSALQTIQFSDGSAECQYGTERLTGAEAMAFLQPFVDAWAEANAARTHAVSPEAALEVAKAAEPPKGGETLG